MLWTRKLQGRRLLYQRRRRPRLPDEELLWFAESLSFSEPFSFSFSFSESFAKSFSESVSESKPKSKSESFPESKPKLCGIAHQLTDDCTASRRPTRCGWTSASVRLSRTRVCDVSPIYSLLSFFHSFIDSIQYNPTAFALPPDSLMHPKQSEREEREVCVCVLDPTSIHTGRERETETENLSSFLHPFTLTRINHYPREFREFRV
jgi:hypothetical protein